jgi:hypothetical protein
VVVSATAARRSGRDSPLWQVYQQSLQRAKYVDLARDASALNGGLTAGGVTSLLVSGLKPSEFESRYPAGFFVTLHTGDFDS